jgi:hypothetical protein
MEQEGEYFLRFPVSIRDRVWQVTLGSSDGADVVAGAATVHMAETEYTLRVRTYDLSGSPTSRPFHLAVHRI